MTNALATLRTFHAWQRAIIAVSWAPYLLISLSIGIGLLGWADDAFSNYYPSGEMPYFATVLMALYGTLVIAASVVIPRFLLNMSAVGRNWFFFTLCMIALAFTVMVAWFIVVGVIVDVTGGDFMVDW